MTESFVSGLGVCAKCGGTISTSDDPPADNSVVTCQTCGQEIGTYADINAKVREMVFAHAESVATKPLSDFKRHVGRIGKRL
jgi:hypothetical protein